MSPKSSAAEALPKPRRGRPPQISAEMVVEAATTLFARRGYRSTTIMAIANALGVTDASILHYFDNKRAILDAVLERYDIPANESFRELLAPGGIEALRNLAGWGAHMEANPESTSLHLVLSAEGLGDASELHGMFESRYRYIRRRVVGAIKQGIESGEIRQDVDAEHEATAWIAFVDGLRLQWFLANRQLELDKHLRVHTEHLIERIRAS